MWNIFFFVKKRPSLDRNVRYVYQLKCFCSKSSVVFLCCFIQLGINVDVDMNNNGNNCAKSGRMLKADTATTLPSGCHTTSSTTSTKTYTRRTFTPYNILSHAMPLPEPPNPKQCYWTKTDLQNNHYQRLDVSYNYFIAIVCALGVECDTFVSNTPG